MRSVILVAMALPQQIGHDRLNTKRNRNGDVLGRIKLNNQGVIGRGIVR